MRDQRKKRHLLLAVTLVLILYLLTAFISMTNHHDGPPLSRLFPSDFFQRRKEASKSVEKNTEHSSPNSSLFAEMKDINKSAENIFFIESRCVTEKLASNFKDNKGFVLNARQCCAIESTAKTNSDRPVYIFHSCPLGDDFLNHSPQFAQQLFRYPNVRVVRLHMRQACMGSPIQELYEKRLLETSSYPVEHTSDVLRLALLWRFGGTYCDLDVVTIRSLGELKTNWAGMQDEATVASGVLNFQPDGVAHEMLQEALEHINAHYDPYNWSTNGPVLITPIILDECQADTVMEAVRFCNGSFTVYGPNVLYPIYYNLAGEFFNEILGRELVRKFKKDTYSVHLWNKMSRDLQARVNSTQAYALLAQEFCPLVHNHCGAYF